jgi:methionyl-tRNA synthetase
MHAVYVTTAIPYVNGRPHVGFALELVQADIIARYHRLLGRKTRLQTGTDENAFKNVLVAQGEGLSPQELVDRNSAVFRTLGQALEISADDFVRTTEARHERAVAALWQRLRQGDVYRRQYRGLYCTGCEDFYLERDLVEGRCPDHGIAPTEVAEENFFFRLSAYQDQIEELLESGRLRVRPLQRRNEVLSFVRRGLEDFSISRDARRVQGWGIEVPGHGGQRVYVWIDALVNYLSGPGFGTDECWKSWWNEGVRKVHVIGKNVWKFHAVYWPALLLSAGLPLPDELVVHGFLTENGRKISKSQGNGIDPLSCVEEFGADAVRYYLLRGVPPFADGDFSLERLRALYNADLANGLGNLAGRLTALAQRSGYGAFAAASAPAPPGYHEALEEGEFDQALASLWERVAHLNCRIEEVRPWALDAEAVHRYLDCWLPELHRIGYWLAPFLPKSSQRLRAALAQEPLRALRHLFPRMQ